MFSNKRVTLIVTGSIAVYKSAILVRELIKNDNQVRVIMTKAAAKFVTPLTFQTLSKQQVIIDEFQDYDVDKVLHIDIADHTDVTIVAPATASIIGKMANGIGDDAASTVLLANHAPLFVVPTMNSNMLANPANQRNLAQLQADGVNIMSPATGFLAEGYNGKGRMPEPTDILEWVNGVLLPEQILKGKHIIVTAGGTREAIDPVRYITNHSSGKMGFAIAQAAANAGAEVSLIAANTSIPVPNGVDFIPVVTAKELEAAVMKRFTSADGLVMSAAVADFRPAVVADHKIKKTKDNDNLTISMVKNPDIVKQVGAIKQPQQFVVGFAAETNDLLANATKKIQSKNLDLIVANDVANSQIGFNSDQNQVTFMWPDGQTKKTVVESKAKVADELIQIIAKL
ncbi:bifunctional phosphopantothenoylcysteine decarboxylase/phosphopantothenate--cysteine ligase CoaBC [Lentilactobacillus sp. SPB1-3]|uniref:Bifunctional phosphopantothenoylcysteine decarboxylase/phosphopantothenate--cysteine ligase CoaBC n=1 Tax=Lentilactobacillus terminaliae TaxID=3003483 RepID=A0ACD5DBZ7_9LACO|nr:bifunctional phosphopantothenoylcysteine decarboxylase/phosphopantothenate--cysteine ligase CoaBC [Lentilactobacillus sp. SPB1-3]MCZ0977165.1 bifunctional phosphopantothenoylcysteine decarboxylase/phosphopantothenate--cysteine ligase CoaBC [Lentilactobacillus sp. SPB1-3]